VNNYLSELKSVNFARKNKKRGLLEFNSKEHTREARFPRIIGKTLKERGILSPLADLIKGGVGKSMKNTTCKSTLYLARPGGVVSTASFHRGLGVVLIPVGL